MTLAPRSRLSLYDIVRPPAGWSFDAMIVCTYSADLRSILALPGAVVVDGQGGRMLADRVTPAQLALLRRTCERSLIFCQEAALLGAEQLTSAIIETEPMVKAVTAPGGGAFHPKVWMVRFRMDDRICYRLAVMSRNLTADRSWDVGVILEGRLTDRPAQRDGLGTLLNALSGRCRRPLNEVQQALLSDFASTADRIQWTLPQGLTRLQLHVTGLGAQWAPPQSDRLAVFSPFLDKGALEALAGASNEAVLLVSRPDALDRCWTAANTIFARKTVLAPPSDLASDLPSGALHAKVFAWEVKGRCGLAVGSMNATSAALRGRNVEFMAVVDATKALPLGLASLVDEGPLAACLADYLPPSDAPVDAPPPDDRPARRKICDLNLKLVCTAQEEDWRLELVAESPLEKSAAALLKGLTFRPATLAASRAAPCLSGLARDARAVFPTLMPLASITGYVVFEAKDVGAFTLNLPVEGVTDDARRTAALRTILPDERSFMEFIRAFFDDPEGLNAAPGGEEDQELTAWGAGIAQGGLLEMMVRCAADEPQRLHQLGDAIRSLGAEEFERLAPEAFRTLWITLARDAGVAL